jgi:prolipoprotein diacylglyceryltransferase
VPYGTVFALYVTLYNFYRVPLETLKIDTADVFFGQRVNVWVSGVLFVAGLISFIVLFRRRSDTPLSTTPAVAAAVAAGHTPTPRPEAAIAARQRTQRRKKT